MSVIEVEAIVEEQPERYDWPKLVDDLNRLLRLRVTPIGMKMFASRVEMEAVPKIRRPKDIHTTDQVVAQAARLGWTVGITAEDLVGAQCSAVIGLSPRDEKWLSGKNMAGVWFETLEDSAQHQAAMDLLEFGRYEAMAVSPLTTGRLDPPDICLIYATPGQMMIFINGLQWSGYRKFEWSVVGESACADSWGRALKTGEPSLAIPCFAERLPRRRAPDGVPAEIPSPRHRRDGATLRQRSALPDPPVRHPERCARRTGEKLRVNYRGDTGSRRPCSSLTGTPLHRCRPG